MIGLGSDKKRPRSVYWEDRTRKSHLSCELLPVAGHSSIGISMSNRQSLGGKENKRQFTAFLDMLCTKYTKSVTMLLESEQSWHSRLPLTF